MSGTPEYYFKLRWTGLEKIGQILGRESISFKKNSLELSDGEKLNQLIEVTELVLSYETLVKREILDGNLTQDDLNREFMILELRINDAIKFLNERSKYLEMLRLQLNTSLANVNMSKDYENLLLQKK